MSDRGTVRPVRPADHESLTELWLELIEHHRALTPALGGVHPSREALRPEIERALASPHCGLWIAETEGKGVGFLVAEIEARETGSARRGSSGWIHEAYVRPDRRARGLGSELVRAALTWLHSRGATRVSVRVESANPAAHLFWKRHGFEDRAHVLERGL